MSDRMETRKGAIMHCVLGIVVAASLSSSALGQAYHKTFYVEGVAAGATINGGAVTQTWVTEGGTTLVDARHRMHLGPRPVWGRYEHAVTRTDQDMFGPFNNIGFPINGNNVGTAANGWNPARIMSMDGHENESWADVDVDSIQAMGPTVRLRGGAERQLMNSVKAVIQGDAEAGPLPHTDEAEAHTADSFAAAQVAGAKTWVETTPGDRPRVKAYSRGAMWGGGWAQNADSNPNIRGTRMFGKTRDPMYITMTDLDSGWSITEDVLTYDVSWIDSEYIINEEEMTFTIPKHLLNAKVEVNFSTESDWVEDSYFYGILLDHDGFEVYGDLPDISHWSLIETAETITWSLDLDGQPLFDFATITAPDDLVVPGRSYQFDIGEGDGTYAAATYAPSPSSVALLLVAALHGARRRL